MFSARRACQAPTAIAAVLSGGQGSALGCWERLPAHPGARLTLMETEGTHCREGGLYCDGSGPFGLWWQGAAASSGQQVGRELQHGMYTL